MEKNREEEQERRGTALEEVMTSLCVHHRVLLLHILQETTSFLPKDDCGAVTSQGDVCGTARSEHSGHCYRADESLCVLRRCVAARCGCPCRLGACALRSMCLGMKSCGGFSCPSLALACVDCCTHAQTQTLEHPHTPVHSSDITHPVHTGSIPQSHCHSPSPPPLSPPPLSPKPQDAESSHDPDMPTLNTHSLNTQPPPLLPHNTLTDQTLTPDTHTKPEDFIELMDKFTDTLMEASERELGVPTHTGDGVKACDDTHLTEIITTVLHSSSEKDYNLKELFDQHLASEKRSPQTRSQRRQEVMQAISRSYDQPATRRQSLQIKRDIARLEPDISRKKKKKTQLVTHDWLPNDQSPDASILHAQCPDISLAQSPDKPISHTQSPDTPISLAQSPDTPISLAQSPDTPISLAHRPDTPISLAQSKDMPISHAQSPDTPISLAQSPDTPISLAQSKDMPISLAQSKDMPISHAQSPGTPVSLPQSPDTPISLAQSKDMPISDTQYPDTPILHTQCPDTPISLAQSPDTPISHTQSPDMPISHTQSPDTPIPLAQSKDMPISHTQYPDTPILHIQCPDMPISLAQSPDTPISHTRSPDTPISLAQSKDTAISHTQHPDTPILHTQCPDTPILLAQSPDTPISLAQSPDTPILLAQSPDTPISLAQSPDTPISLAQSPDTPILLAQSPDTPISLTQSPDTPISHTLYSDMPISNNQNMDMPISLTQSLDTPVSLEQSLDTPISLAQSPDTPILHIQYKDTTNLHFQSLDMPISHALSAHKPISHAQSPEMPSSHAHSPDSSKSNTQSPHGHNSYSQRQDTPNGHSDMSETCTVKAELCSNLRSRRNIVRPQHLASYVTEPRKMFYTACRSAKANSPLLHSTDKSEHPSTTVLEQLKTPPVSPTKKKVCTDENSAQSDDECRLRVKTRRSEDITLSPSPDVNDSTDPDNIKYVSPIKLMLVSTIKDEDGVKYTLRAAQSHNDDELFDPCEEALWARNTIKEQAMDETLQTMSNECIERLSTKETANVQGLNDCVDSVNETEPTFKRRPGRPKKLKAPTEKVVKRPIGRPRKPKPADTKVVPSVDTEKQKVEVMSSAEDGNKNLKITIMYGRRKARRMVCEGQVPTEQSKGNGVLTQNSNVEESAQSTQTEVGLNKDQLSLVMPVEDRKNLTHSIMCPKQNEGAGMRKPGRPPKVKISGISVTVTTVSPRQRKIHLKRDVREPEIQRRALMTELEPNEEQKTITEETQASVRHSVRERRPSIHLLRCVAMSGSSTPAPRSRKLLMNKFKKTQQETQQHESKHTSDTETGPNTSPKDAVPISAASVESLFDANVQWWPTSASPETIKEEMNRRLKVMKETWVSDKSEVITSDEDNGSAPGSSAVRTLFERDCSMETLCSWFMQSTETQSLAIVKKANNRNPCEVFQYSSVQANDRPNICSSPQAERLRKCVKKFATVIPKSPTNLRQAQAKIEGTQNSFTKQHILTTNLNDNEESQRYGAWSIYRSELDRARSRFKSRTKNTDTDCKSLNKPVESGIQPVSVSEHGLLNTVQRESRRTSTPQKQITANAWSAHTLRECKVFLRKLNSANTRSLSEESNDCTVRFSVSPAGGGSGQHREQGVRKSINVEKTSNLGTPTRLQSKVNRKHRHSCTNVLPPSPKRQRSSRGVMAAKWSDFILGPAR